MMADLKFNLCSCKTHSRSNSLILATSSGRASSALRPTPSAAISAALPTRPAASASFLLCSNSVYRAQISAMRSFVTLKSSPPCFLRSRAYTRSACWWSPPYCSDSCISRSPRSAHTTCRSVSDGALPNRRNGGNGSEERKAFYLWA